MGIFKKSGYSFEDFKKKRVTLDQMYEDVALQFYQFAAHFRMIEKDEKWDELANINPSWFNDLRSDDTKVAENAKKLLIFTRQSINYTLDTSEYMYSVLLGPMAGFYALINMCCEYSGAPFEPEKLAHIAASDDVYTKTQKNKKSIAKEDPRIAENEILYCVLTAKALVEYGISQGQPMVNNPAVYIDMVRGRFFSEMITVKSSELYNTLNRINETIS